MKTLKRRMDRLAVQINAEAACLVCGRRLGMTGPRKGERVVILFDDQTNDTPDHCPGCGVQQVIRITFDD